MLHQLIFSPGGGANSAWVISDHGAEILLPAKRADYGKDRIIGFAAILTVWILGNFSPTELSSSGTSAALPFSESWKC